MLLKIKNHIKNSNHFYIQICKYEIDIKSLIKINFDSDPIVKNFPSNAIFLKIKDINFTYQFDDSQKIFKIYKLLYNGEIFFADSKYFLNL